MRSIAPRPHVPFGKSRRGVSLNAFLRHGDKRAIDSLTLFAVLEVAHLGPSCSAGLIRFRNSPYPARWLFHRDLNLYISTQRSTHAGASRQFTEIQSQHHGKVLHFDESRRI